MQLVFDNIVYNLQTAGGISRFWSRITGDFAASALFIESGSVFSNIYRGELQYKKTLPDSYLPKKIARYKNFNRSFFNAPHIFHSSYYRINKNKFALNVTTIHDLIYEKFGSGLGCRIHLWQKKNALLAAEAIVCVSENTKADLFQYYPFCKDKRVVVIPNGVDPIKQLGTTYDPVDKLTEQIPFFLYVGHRGECKGFNRIFDALKFCPTNWRCIVVGAPFSAEELAEIHTHNMESRVFNVGKVSDSVLNSLYKHAEFLFFPSLYEGFGIPPLEAMQHGCPVVASNRSSIPEVVGSAGILFDPDDRRAIESAMSEIMKPNVRNQLITSGLIRTKLFTWESAVASYAELYSQLLSRN